MCEAKGGKKDSVDGVLGVGFQPRPSPELITTYLGLEKPRTHDPLPPLPPTLPALFLYVILAGPRQHSSAE